MTDEPANLILEILGRMDAKVDRVLEDMHDLKARMTGVETALAGVQRRIDHVEDRLDHIERRLELVDAQPGQ